jgi:hypothetical protein
MAPEFSQVVGIGAFEIRSDLPEYLLSDPAPVRLRQQPDLLHLAPKPLGLAYEKPGQQILRFCCLETPGEALARE